LKRSTYSLKSAPNCKAVRCKDTFSAIRYTNGIYAQTIKLNRKAIVANVNTHAMNLAYDNPWFRDFLNDADIVFCDGFGVMWVPV
jgi:UDP-N-acetyl-D-mannosaminuronic acid transferase (WecB/TagA/CpsF family)